MIRHFRFPSAIKLAKLFELGEDSKISLVRQVGIRHACAMQRNLLLVLLATHMCAFAQTGSIRKAAPEFDQIVPAGAKIEKLASGFKFTEGPVWIDEGYLLFSDIPNGRGPS